MDVYCSKKCFSNLIDRLKPSIYYRIKDKIYNFKMRCQRFKRGYSDSDVWNLNINFLNIMPQLLDQLIKNHWGHPNSMTDEEWVAILEEMKFCFEEASEDNCSQKNEFEDKFNYNMQINTDGKIELLTDNEEMHQLWFKREKELGEYRYKMQQKALKLFVKYFDDLWD